MNRRHEDFQPYDTGLKMTSFATTNIPASVNTIEKLAAWTNGILYELHKNSRYAEADNAPLVPIVTAQDGLAASKQERMIFRLSLHLDDGWRQSGDKLWYDVLELSNAPIPSDFLTD